MAVCSSDLYALILSFCAMKDQLLGSRVCITWRNLVKFHPSLLNVMDIGGRNSDSYSDTEQLVKLVLRLAHVRVRTLRISAVCAFLFDDLVSKLPNLVRISISDHIKKQWVHCLLKLFFGHRSATPPTITFLDCSCHLSRFIDQIQTKKSYGKSVPTLIYPSAMLKQLVITDLSQVNLLSLSLKFPKCILCQANIDSPCHLPLSCCI